MQILHKCIQLLKEQYSLGGIMPPPHLDFAQSDLSRYVKFANPLVAACIILYKVSSPVRLEDNTVWKADINDALCKILLSSLFVNALVSFQFWSLHWKCISTPLVKI
uniref:Uncharacterized protein n=1 Tax=Micrurus corallinus TaxID=54390 RepID=A0A2D4FX54_MICCO